jgi:6-phosphogluconolactonase (cycloisomerase 2 family)
MGCMMLAYVGSRTSRERNARGDGISVYRCNVATGALTLVQVLGGLVNPSFLALNKAGSRLYAVHGDCEDISAFVVDEATGHLANLNRQSTQGKNPVHVALDPSERCVVVSNHITSSLVVLPIEANGALGAVCQRVSLEGEPGPHRKEQPFAKPHFNLFDPSGRYVVVPDKGLDRVFSFHLGDDGRLAPASAPPMVAREGSGPRHVAFHPNRPWAYVVNELDSTITACLRDEDTGGLQPFQVVSALSDRYTGNSRASEIEVHPGGGWLYASNRGEETIAVLGIDGRSGRLSLIQSMPCGGKTPRFFALTPDGRWMYVLNEDSDTIITLAVDAQTGLLSHTGQSLSCRSPVCLVFRTI